jgi:hypothetical protein
MSSDSVFWLSLVVKMAVAAGFVIAATVIAERAGAFIGSLILTLPISTGPAFVFVALDHDSDFVVRAALTGVVNNVPTVLYTLVFIFMAQLFGAFLSVAAGLLVWLTFTILLNMNSWDLQVAAALNVICVVIACILVRRFRDAPMVQLPLRWPELLVRACMVSLLIAAVVTLSFAIGPEKTGILASFPATFTATMFILHRRVGGAATAAVMAHSVPGLLGFGFAIAVLYLTAVPLGTPLSLTLALAFSISWNVSILQLRRAGISL